MNQTRTAKDAHFLPQKTFDPTISEGCHSRSDLNQDDPGYQGTCSKGHDYIGPSVVVRRAFEPSYCFPPTTSSPDGEPLILDFDELMRKAKERYESRIMEQATWPGSPSHQKSSQDYITAESRDCSPHTSSGSGLTSDADHRTEAQTTSETGSSQDIDVVTVDEDFLPQFVAISSLVPNTGIKREKVGRRTKVFKRFKTECKPIRSPSCLGRRLIKTEESRIVPYTSITVGKSLSQMVVKKLVSPNVEGKFYGPPLSFTCLSALCLQSSLDGHMPVTDMYAYIE